MSGVLVNQRLTPCLIISFEAGSWSLTTRVLSAEDGTLSFGDWLGLKVGLDLLSSSVIAPCREP